MLESQAGRDGYSVWTQVELGYSVSDCVKLNRWPFNNTFVLCSLALADGYHSTKGSPRVQTLSLSLCVCVCFRKKALEGLSIIPLQIT